MQNASLVHICQCLGNWVEKYMCGNSPLGPKQYEEGKICGRRRVKDGRKDFNTGRSFFKKKRKEKNKFSHKYSTLQC